MSKLLINEYPLLVLPGLAAKIGLNEALVVQQLHYWIEKSNIRFDDKKWVYNTIEEWENQFPFWSKNTIKRTFENLEKLGLIFKEKLAKNKFDKTNYYSINYNILSQIENQKSSRKETKIPANNESTDEPNLGQSMNSQNGSTDEPNLGQSYIVKSFDIDYLTETTTKTTLSPTSLNQKNEEIEIQEQKAEREDFVNKTKKPKKSNYIFFTSFDHFVNFVRSNYQNKEIIRTTDKYTKEEISLSVSNKGLLYNRNNSDDLNATRAKEMWQSLYQFYLEDKFIIDEEILIEVTS